MILTKNLIEVVKVFLGVTEIDVVKMLLATLGLIYA